MGCGRCCPMSLTPISLALGASRCVVEAEMLDRAMAAVDRGEKRSVASEDDGRGRSGVVAWEDDDDDKTGAGTMSSLSSSEAVRRMRIEGAPIPKSMAAEGGCNVVEFGGIRPKCPMVIGGGAVGGCGGRR